MYANGLKQSAAVHIFQVVLAVCLCWICLPVCAQTNRSNLSGTVADPTGAQVPGATVVITNQETGITRKVTTNASGVYSAASLVPGRYSIQVSAKGFSVQVIQNVVLTVGQSFVQNVALQIGSISQKVVVQDNPASVDTTSSDLSASVQGQTMRALPLNGRSWTDLAELSPGVTAIKTQAPISAPDRMKRGLGGELSISGGRPQQNSYLLDGININDYSNAGPGSVLGGNLGVDALQEFNVITTNPPAQYGRTASGVITAVTRSGTNQFHGSAYEFARNAALDARNYFDPPQIPDFSRNQFGGSFGGPIRKDSTFIFGDYEGVRQNLGLSVLDTVPTANARAGILSTGNVTPDPSIVNFLNTFYPLPNVGPTDGDIGNYTFPAYQITSENYFTVRFDHTFSADDSAGVVYMYDNAPSQQPDEFNNVSILSKTVRQTLSILETHILSATTVNTFHLGYNRDNAGSPYAANGVKPAANDTSYGFQPTDAAGQVMVPGLTTFSGGTTSASPLLFHWNSFQGYDDVSLTRGIHNISFGGSFERIYDNQLSSDAPGGIFSFNSLPEFLTNQPFSFITTLPSTLTPRNLRQNIFGVYGMDDIRINPHFTLNLGLRYEISSVPYEVHGKLSNLRVLAGNTPHTGNPYIQNPTFKNIEPRLGFAWDPFHDGKTSVRGGAGVYDILPYIVEMGSGVDASYPFAEDASTSNLPAGAFPTGAYQIVANDTSTRNYYVLQYKPPRNYVLMWNTNVQRAFGQNTTLLVGYVGSRGIHNWYQTDDGNIVLPTTYDPATNSYYWPTPIGSGTVVDPLVGQTLDARWNGDSYFEGLESQLTETDNHGLQGQVAYTWSRCIDTSSGSAASDQYRNSLNVDLYTAPRTHRGPCDTNIGQSLTVNTMWSIPGSQKLHGFAGWLANGWQAGGIANASTGPPFSVTIGGDPLGTNAAIPFDFPDRVKGCKLTTGKQSGFINLNCFTFPNPVNRMGNAGRNELVGPNQFEIDFSGYKNTPLKRISDGASLQVRAEIYNILNHTNLDAPTDNFQVFDGSGNQVQSAGLIDQTVTSSRQIQLGVKLTF
jgi:hypothetical protein